MDYKIMEMAGFSREELERPAVIEDGTAWVERLYQQKTGLIEKATSET
jgi:hypothetical protein